jgi:hypothetical protein
MFGSIVEIAGILVGSTILIYVLTLEECEHKHGFDTKKGDMCTYL